MEQVTQYYLNEFNNIVADSATLPTNSDKMVYLVANKKDDQLEERLKTILCFMVPLKWSVTLCFCLSNLDKVKDLASRYKNLGVALVKENGNPDISEIKSLHPNVKQMFVIESEAILVGNSFAGLSIYKKIVFEKSFLLNKNAVIDQVPKAQKKPIIKIDPSLQTDQEEYKKRLVNVLDTISKTINK